MSEQQFMIGDPVMDAAQGRPMVVVSTPDLSVKEWSEQNSYSLVDNYANSKFDPEPSEWVVECVYVSDVRSEPSKTYTFPVSRVALIDAHHADDGPRLAHRAIRGALAALFEAAAVYDDAPDADAVDTLVAHAGIPQELRETARELADIEQRFGEAQT